MKRILLLTLLSCVGLCTQILSVFAQQGEKSVGINVGYGTASSFESFRLGAEFNWNATDHIRLSPSFDCYFASSTSYVVSADDTLFISDKKHMAGLSFAGSHLYSFHD